MRKKNWISIVIISVLITGLFVIQKFYLQDIPVVYPNFGITVPAGYQTHGIDVSRYQKKIDWKQVSEMRDQGQRISFAIIKATEGTQLKDAYFDQNWDNIQETDIIRGAYLYFHPNRDGEDQAAHFISHVTLEKGDLPPVVDIEELNRTPKPVLQKRLQICLDELEKAYGVKPIIYTNTDFYDRNLGPSFDNYPYWAAHYEQPNAPRTSRKWHIWQHNCNGRVNGIDAAVDFNVVNGSIFSLKELCIQ